MRTHEEPSIRASFWALGALAAALDFAIFALLTSGFGVRPFYANVLSVSAAMACVGLPKWIHALRTPGGDRARPITLWSFAALAAYMALTIVLCSWVLEQIIALGVDPLRAKVAFTAAAALINYVPLDRFFVHRRLHAPSFGAGVALCAVLLGAQRYLPGVLYPVKAEPELAALYAAPMPPAEEKMRVFHLGHSLVGRDMPAMLAQLAGGDHGYELQLGWGTPLRTHWEPEVEILGFSHENATPRYRDARAALASGDYDAFVMTEMIKLSDAIRWHDSSRYAAKWAEAAFAGRPDIKVYLYETWHPLDEPSDWLEQISEDLDQLWLARLLWPAVRGTGRPIYLVPAGHVMARLVREVERHPEGLHGMRDRWDLFAIDADGKQDSIHLNEIGMYLVALTHYAVLYRTTPVGLPHELLRADGTPAKAPSPDLAKRMQEIVWEVVTGMELTGVKAHE